MKRRNDLYITEYMLQASMQNRLKRKPTLWKYGIVAGIAVLLVGIALYLVWANT